jgi:heavy metal translocating P-type ATPase
VSRVSRVDVIDPPDPGASEQTTAGRSGVPDTVSSAHRLGAAGTGRVRSFLALPEVRWAAVALLTFLIGLVLRVAGAPSVLPWVFFAACYVSGGWEPAVAGLRALRERRLDVDLLMIVAALVAAGIGQVLDGALLIVIFATSGALEAVATKRTRDSVRDLLAFAPDRATRVLADGLEETVDTAVLAIGDLVLVRPGERIGADGTVESGASDVDQAGITGEPMPVVKTTGSEVFAGTVNGTGVLRVRVQRAAHDTVVARIVTLVEEASATKATTQLFIDKIEQRYSVGMVAATVALFLVPLAVGSALQPTLLRAMTFMIVASPCGVVLATMPPLLSSIANAGRHGVLVKSAVVMEQLGSTGVVAFDKTGTLTEGTPRVVDVLVLPGCGLVEDDLIGLAAAAEQPSEHPLARAVVDAADHRGLTLATAADFSATPGRGVIATVDGRTVAVGSPVLLDPTLDHHRLDPSTAAAVARFQDVGRTAVVVTVDGRPVGVLALVDRVRRGSAAAVAALTAVTGSTPVLLTGDNAGAAALLARDVGISDVRAGLLPHDKVAAVRALQASGTAVAVVGDGVNDAPALAAADTGIAMGRHGSDLALDTADVVLVRDDLATLAAVIDLSRQARRIVIQNLVLAAAAIAILVTIDLSGYLPLPLGVAGHEGSTVLIGLNGLRLLSRRAWRVRDPNVPDDPT